MLHLLATFCAVVDTGSLSRAAEQLHLTQPAVTRQIKALEQELGAVLLTRTTSGVGLTPAGEQVLPHARRALAAVAACHRAAADASPEPGRLRLAAGNMLMQFILPRVLTAFKAQRPEVQIQLHTGHYQECLERVIAYEADLALIASHQIPPGLKARPLFADPITLVIAPTSALAGREWAELKDLQGLSLFVLPRQSGLRQHITEVLAAAGVSAAMAEQPTVEALKTMVLLELGASLLPRSAVADEVKQGRLMAVPVRDWPESGRTILAVTRAEGELPEPARSFRQALLHQYAQA